MDRNCADWAAKCNGNGNRQTWKLITRRVEKSEILDCDCCRQSIESANQRGTGNRGVSEDDALHVTQAAMSKVVCLLKAKKGRKHGWKEGSMDGWLPDDTEQGKGQSAAASDSRK